MDDARAILESAALRAMGSIDEVTASDGIERLDVASASRAVPRGFDLLVRGWIADDSRKSLARSVSAFVDDRPVPVRYGFSRADVAGATGIAELERAGFRIGIALADFPNGSHLLRVLAEQADGAYAALDPIAFEIVEANAGALAGASNFILTIDTFGSDFPHPAGGRCVEKGNVAVIRGSIRDARSGEGAHAIVGVVDRFEAEPAQGGFAHRSGDHTGFLLCIPTLDLSLGAHEVHVIARSSSNDARRFDPFGFTVTPVACDLASPIASSEEAVAEISWVDASESDTNLERRVEASGAVHLRGFAFDPRAGDAVAEAFVAFEDGAQIALQTRQYRPDVALRFASPKARYCGIVGSIALGHLPPGKHLGRLFVRAKDDQTFHTTGAVIRLDVAAAR